MAFDYSIWVKNCYWDTEQDCYISAGEPKQGSTHVATLVLEEAKLKLYKTFNNYTFTQLVGKRFIPLDSSQRAKLLLIYVGTAEGD